MFSGIRKAMKWMKPIALVCVCMAMANCQKVDDFGEEGMMEAFSGYLLVTPGMDEEIMAKTVSPALIAFQSDGKTAEMAGPDTKPFSLREMLMADASEHDKELLAYTLKKKGLHPDDQLQFSGFRATVNPDNPRHVFFNDFVSATKAIRQMNVQVAGEAILDPDNKLYARVDLIVFITLKDLKNNMEEILELFTYGQDEVPLEDMEDLDTKIPIAHIQFVGPALTGYF
jgi:hypothetical protein